MKRRCFCLKVPLTWNTGLDRRCIGRRGKSWLFNKEFLEVQSPPQLHLCNSLMFLFCGYGEIYKNVSCMKNRFHLRRNKHQWVFLFCPSTEDFRLNSSEKIGNPFNFGVLFAWVFRNVCFPPWLFVFLIMNLPVTSPSGSNYYCSNCFHQNFLVLVSFWNPPTRTSRWLCTIFSGKTFEDFLASS